MTLKASAPVMRQTMEQFGKDMYGFPCVLLSFESSVYASFAPLTLLNGSTSNPKDVFFYNDIALFNGPIDDFIYAIQQSLNIANDVVLSFQDMGLELHSDSYMTNSLCLEEIHKVYTDMRLTQNYLGKIPPLKLKITDMGSCFKRQLNQLKLMNQAALKNMKCNPYLNKGDCENPIAIDDDPNEPKITQLMKIDQVIVIDDDVDVIDDRKTEKITRPFVRCSRKRRIVQKDLRGSSSIFRFTLK